MGAFGLKSALMARHAQHVVLIHFPIALFLVGVVFDLLAQWTRREALATVAFYNIVVAAISVVPVLITGVLAWRWQLEGQKLHGTLLLHLAFGCTSAMLILLTAWLYVRARRQQTSSFSVRIPIELLAAIAIIATAHLGGIVSGVNLPA
jgi:uncharacterized membrane protein